MNRRVPIAFVAVTIMLMLGAANARSNDNETALKERFKERYSTLMRLKDSEKLGETFLGFVDVVEPQYLGEPIDPDESEGSTIATFIAEENSDRTALYRLIAEKTSTKEEDVAKRNAKRLFQKARMNHFLKRSDGVWVQKKDLRK